MCGVTNGPDNKQLKKDSLKNSVWKKELREPQVMGSCLLRMDSCKIRSELVYVLYFIPMNYINDTIIPVTIDYVKIQNLRWRELNFIEFLHLMRIFLSMVVC